MELHKFASSHSEVVKAESEQKIKVPENTKALGLKLHLGTDRLSYEAVKPNFEFTTKRSILKTHAQVFSPLGLISSQKAFTNVLAKRLRLG